MPQYSSPRSDRSVLIVGGGIAGAGIGAELSGKAAVLLVEAEDQCGYHSTGRSAAFWLESYGGPIVAGLSSASHDFLDRPPTEFSDHGFLRPRGALHVSDEGWAELPDRVESRRVDRQELEQRIPGIRERWQFAVEEPRCADIDVAGLHAAYLRQLRRSGGQVRTDSRLASARWNDGEWQVTLEDGTELRASVIVDSAGAWADPVAKACGVPPLGIAPKRRTMVQMRMGRSGLALLPLVNDAAGHFYFKGEGDRTLWLSPHDEIATDPCDAAPEEIDIAAAIDRFERVVDWPIEAVERSWAGLRSFAPDRLPVYGYDPVSPGFFWCAGQGGFGIQTAPAASKMAAALLLGEPMPDSLAGVDPLCFSPARFR